ncbi:MAG TPA: biotin/lipoyl-containing protein [Kofleriaceae bacterium]|nr:biotin/lipoyl-containing protein [Kofleriaceae bacterium]
MRRELSAQIGGREVGVVVELAPDGRWTVAVGDGPARPVDAVEIRPGTWSLLCEGRSILVDVDRRAQGAALLVAGEEVAVELVDARRRRLAQAVGQGGRAAGRGETVRAPIAGKVVLIPVEVGQEVAAGQGVVVLEAMKMENEIRADRGGVVSAIRVEPGQSVETGETLVVLE